MNNIKSMALKLNKLNFIIDNEWIGTLLLAGLRNNYYPMIISLESSGNNIKADSIKIKLL